MHKSMLTHQCVINSDLIIIATPLSSYKEIILSIKDNLKKNVILTDTGSVKKEVMKKIRVFVCYRSYI